MPQAAPRACTIKGITPSSVTLGLSAKKVKFTPVTSGCKVTSWSIATDSFVVTNKSPYATLNPLSAPEKTQDAVVEVTAHNGLPTKEVTFVDGLHLKAPTESNTRTKAGPEPAKKGHEITVSGQLVVVSWKQDAWTGYAGQNLKVQFKAKGGHYTTVKTVRSGEYGYTQTTVTAKKSGTWRTVYAGTADATSATARGDYVKVTRRPGPAARPAAAPLWGRRQHHRNHLPARTPEKRHRRELAADHPGAPDDDRGRLGRPRRAAEAGDLLSPATRTNCRPSIERPTKPRATAKSRQKPRSSSATPMAAKTSGRQTTATYAPNQIRPRITPRMKRPPPRHPG